MLRTTFLTLASAAALVGALASLGCGASTAVVSTPSSTYVTVGRRMYRCQANAGARPVCQQVTEL